MITPAQSARNRRFLDLAARSALRAAGDVEPNPLVGAVIASGDTILGIGHHRRFGQRHAEADALDNARAQGHNPRGASLYVTLEPCNGRGSNPPCVDAILDAGLAHVVIARRDPNPAKSGGLERLAAAGVTTELSTDSPLATGLAAPFVKRLKTGLPWVIAKWAQTIDGRIATRTGESRWISSDASRLRVHRLRSRVDAILTGIGTILADDPQLTARGVRKVHRVARRVIADTDLDIPTQFFVVRTAPQIPTTVICARDLATADSTAPKRHNLASQGVELLGVRATAQGIDIEAALRALVERHHTSSVLVEAGPGLLGSLFDADLVDEAIVYVAPMLLGDEHAKSVAIGRVAETLSMGKRFDLWRLKRVGHDVELTYRRREA